MRKLPPRTADTMSMAIGMSSPNGRMSKRAQEAARKEISLALFGEGGLQRARPPQPSRKDCLLREAANLRDLAARGMKVRAFTKEANRLEAEAATIGDA
jgi:hypothetical protein